MGIISLIKEKKKHIIDFFEWKIHFNLMPKVSGLPQYNIPCIFHCHLNKILFKLSKFILCPTAITSIIYWLNFKWFALNSARHWASQATLPSGPGKKVTENGEVLMCFNSNQNTMPVKASSLNFSSPKYTPVYTFKKRVLLRQNTT